MEVHHSSAEPWRVTLVDTGEQTQTGGRLQRVLHYVGDEEFCFTYGDGVSSIDIGELIEFHRDQGALATVTAVQPPGRFGALEIDDDRVRGFQEKPHGDGGWINGGFFVLSAERRPTTSTATTRSGSASRWSASPREGQLAPYRHDGFWHPMDTLRDKIYLEELWHSGQRAVEDVAVEPGVLARQAGAGHRPHRLQGSWLALWLARLGAEVTGYSSRVADRARRCSSWRASRTRSRVARRATCATASALGARVRRAAGPRS